MGNPVIGQILLEQYAVEAFIDSGGMGAIFRVRDLKRNVHLAMKTLHSELAEDPSIIKRFKREANALSKLTHPNIVRTYGLFQTLDFTFLLEDYIDGMSLKELLHQRQGQPLSIGQATAVMKSLTSALGFAHANGVIHCDIKPANVMLDRTGKIFLTDFGIARHADSTTTTLAYAGAPAYMSPEQILGKPVNAATDIYSLGILLYEILTGKKPFSGNEKSTGKGSDTKSERLRFAHLRLTPPDPRLYNPQIPEKLSRVIMRAMEKEPHKRFQDVHAFYKALNQAAAIDARSIPDRLEGLSIPKKHVPKNITANQPIGVNPMILAGIGVAILLFFFLTIGNNQTHKTYPSAAEQEDSSYSNTNNLITDSTTNKTGSTQKTDMPVNKNQSGALEKTPSKQKTSITPTSLPSSPMHCPGTPATRMAEGTKGRMAYKADPGAVALRKEPTIQNKRQTFIKDLREGTRFTVIAGPVCADGYLWWQIHTKEGLEGWSAEGDEDYYYMEPYNW